MGVGWNGVGKDWEGEGGVGWQSGGMGKGR